MNNSNKTYYEDDELKKTDIIFSGVLFMISGLTSLILMPLLGLLFLGINAILLFAIGVSIIIYSMVKPFTEDEKKETENE